MEYSIDALANKMALVIVFLSVIVSLVGLAFFASRGQAEAALPFAIGVAAAMIINIAKVYLLKRAVNKAVTREAIAAKFYLQGQYFLRLMLTLAGLLLVGYLHNATEFVNLFGMVFGIFTFTIAAYSMHFFVRNSDEGSHSDILNKKDSNSITDDAVQEINSIVKKAEISDNSNDIEYHL